MFFYNLKTNKNKFVKTTLIDTLFYFVVYIYISFISPYLNSLGWSEFLKGWFFSIFAITGILTAPIIGTISDKIGRFHLMIIGFSTEIIALIGYIVFSNTLILFLLRVLSAIAFNLVVITAFSRVNDTMTNDNRSKKTGLFHSLLSVSGMIAPLLGGIVADAFGYKAVFMLALITALIFLTSILIHDKLFFKEYSPHRKKEQVKLRDGNPLLDIKDVLRFKPLRQISILGLATTVTTPFTIMVLPYIIIERMNLSNTHLSIALFFMGAVHISQFLLGILADKIGKRKSMIIGLSIFSISFLMMFFAPNYNILLLLILFEALGGSLWNISAWAFMSDIGEAKGIEGKVIGSYSSIIKITQAISFVITGTILSAWKEGIFIFFGLVIIIPLFLIGRRWYFEDKKISYSN